MGICIQRGGPLTTVQDKGRLGYQNLGFSASGAMDGRALRLANLLLDNEENAAVLEVTMVGPKFTFESPNCFVLTGADLKASLNGQALETGLRKFGAMVGDRVRFTPGEGDDDGWIEEILPRKSELIRPSVANADMLIVAGTSLTVYPAAGLIRYYQGNRLVLINRDQTPYDNIADLVLHESLGQVFSQL